ncbi:MAG: hypothetical protein KJ709_03200 [Nanoarchaeota archaeon]|nr:hypothetical protein [Nanoarchaeota archaeon]
MKLHFMLPIMILISATTAAALLPICSYEVAYDNGIDTQAGGFFLYKFDDSHYQDGRVRFSLRDHRQYEVEKVRIWLDVHPYQGGNTILRLVDAEDPSNFVQSVKWVSAGTGWKEFILPEFRVNNDFYLEITPSLYPCHDESSCQGLMRGALGEDQNLPANPSTVYGRSGFRNHLDTEWADGPSALPNTNFLIHAFVKGRSMSCYSERIGPKP